MRDPVDENVTETISTAVDLRQQLAATAAAIAETEDRIADTLDRLALTRPHDAQRLQDRAAHARKFAARERLRAASYRTCASPAAPAPDLMTGNPGRPRRAWSGS
jgi:hypothetical protein